MGCHVLVFSASTRIGIEECLKGNPVFKAVDDMLLRLYYLYKKSPKKCQEMNDFQIVVGTSPCALVAQCSALTK